MGFLSYNLQYYKNQIDVLKSSPANDESLLLARRLLKILYDIYDEGYTALSDELNKMGVIRDLNTYIITNGGSPFELPNVIKEFENITYSDKAIELELAIDDAMLLAENTFETIQSSIINDIKSFCDWIGYEEEIAYIFLLRDTLLPYIYYKRKGVQNIHPWILSRSTLKLLSSKKNPDDGIREAIYSALEYGCTDSFDAFRDFVSERVQDVLNDDPQIKNVLSKALSSIKADKIIVIESGCSGTFPMLLAALDDRVDVRMFTTYPFLLKVYGERIYTAEYEKCRDLELLYSHNLYFYPHSIENGRFNVQKCLNKDIETASFREIKSIIN